jgi:sugar lactone lactonase YvrE
MKLLLLIALLLTVPLARAAITVSNTNDSGPGSLRDAIEKTNASTNDWERIEFNIPGLGIHVIKPAAALPLISKSVVLDGYSQPGSRPNTLAQGDDAVILIEINGELLLGGNDSEVYGLAFPAMQLRGYGDIIQGNFIGADPSGTNRIANASGLYLQAAFAHQIGGVHPADRNLISGNSAGIQGFDAQNPFGPLAATRIEGNYIGTDRSGTRPLTGTGLGNDGGGISIAAQDQIIGGTEPGAGNVIAFNGVGVSVQAQGRANNQLIEGNSIFANAGGGITGGNDGPRITSATPGSNTVSGILAGTPGNSYRIEIFANDSCDPSGFGEGKTFIGFTEATAGPTGEAAFSATVSNPLSAGTVLTATATPALAVNEGTTGFSRCIQAQPPLDLSISVAGPGSPVPTASNATFSLTIANNTTEIATGIAFTGKMPAALQFVSASPGWTNKTGFDPNAGSFNLISTLIPTLAPGASVTGTITFKANAIGNTFNAFQIVGDQPDENQANNEVRLNTVVFNPSPRQLMVTNTEASGPGSLDQAIKDVNNGVGGDTIAFNIPGGGVHQITNSIFDIINVPVTIDGYTQPGSKPNNLAAGDNAVPRIELTQRGFYFTGGSSTVRGLVIPELTFSGKPGGSGGSNAVEGCFIGTDPTGLHGSTNVDDSFNPTARGISILGADDTRIGGASPAERNIISGVEASSGGLRINPAAISTDAARTVIQGNYIGTDATGAKAIGNNGSGISFASGIAYNGPVAGGLVGGTNDGEGNIIAYNNGPGVDVPDPRSNVSILGNSIFGNRAIGTSIGRLRVTGSDSPVTTAINGVGAAPIITNVTSSAGETRVQGYFQGLTNEAYRLDFYSSPVNTDAFVQSEGKALLGTQSLTTDAKGGALFSAILPAASGLISAAATDSAGATSPFLTFFQPPAMPCLKPGDLLAALTYEEAFSTDPNALSVIHAVYARAHDGTALGIPYKREAAYGPNESRQLRDVAAANDALWVVDPALGAVNRISLCGEPLGFFFQDTNALPFSLTFDAGGNVYVGLNVTNNNVKKFDSNGRLLDTYSVYCDHAFGVMGMDLAADQHTLYYGTYGTKIHRYDLASHQQLPDFATNAFEANYFRILPDGGVVAADQRWLRRYDPAGNGVWTNVLHGQFWWNSIHLDPDKKTGWGMDLNGRLAHFDLATGALLETILSDVNNPGEYGSGLAIVGEPVAALSGGGVIPEQPLVQVVRRGAQAVLSWSASIGGFDVQSSPSVGLLASWEKLDTAPSLANGQYSIAVDLSERTRFYRLVKQ